MLLMYSYVLLKMSTWYSKHVEESNNIRRINNIQCITLVVLYGQLIYILKLAEPESEIQVLCWFVFCEIMHSVGSVIHTNWSHVTVCLLRFDELPCGFVSLAIFNIDISSKQITIEHNSFKYSYRYVFRLHGVIIRLVFRTY